MRIHHWITTAQISNHPDLHHSSICMISERAMKDPTATGGIVTRNYRMHQVQVNRGKSLSICMVDSTQSGIGEVQGVTWHVIYCRIWHSPIAPSACNT
ncbi:hypothetical protein COCNU_02G009900 [Cocos nucifera]|uniref:Uncharacterized protein n=1 Tax=Cocos nucifera TaxID=13894 RepID=A0A8K0HZV3_COCNU|nr:hypothetical protein COCNU_02G009900 [Cocos nucifera]